VNLRLYASLRALIPSTSKRNARDGRDEAIADVDDALQVEGSRERVPDGDRQEDCNGANATKEAKFRGSGSGKGRYSGLYSGQHC
jgi:hypothetical protein